MSDQINKEDLKKMFELIDKPLPIPDLATVELADENDPQGMVVGKTAAGNVVLAMPRSVYDVLCQPTVPPMQLALRAAADTLGKIMGALAARGLLKKGVALEVVRKKLEADALSDVQLEGLAADGFEAAAIALKDAGDVTVTMFECGKDPTV